MDQDYQGPPVPSPELVQQWAFMDRAAGATRELWVATQAARWGADQELEACCKWMIKRGMSLDTSDLRAARRPKPSSLKEQALMVLEDGDLGPGASLTPVEVCIIRRALEQLDD